jgi:membrane fusion protein (multidrug efflux system)
MNTLKRCSLPVVLLFALLACKGKPEEKKPKDGGPKAAIVDVIIASNQKINKQIEVNGSVLPNEMTTIQSEVSGRVTFLQIPEGASVAAGTVLARINDADLKASQQKINVQLDLAQKNETRLKKLLSIGGINQADYDLVLNQVNTLKADLAVLQAQLDKTVIKAPFAGTLGLRMISMGAYLTPATVITTIQQVNQLKIDFSVPEFYAQKIKKGAVVHVQSSDNKTKADAVIIATEPLVNATTRNLKVRAVLKGQSFNLGAFVKISIDATAPANSILIPSNCIIPESTVKKVVVVKDGVGQLVEVETGERNEGLVQIVKGLSVGDSIAVSGVLFVKPNSPVKVRSVKLLSDIATLD